MVDAAGTLKESSTAFHAKVIDHVMLGNNGAVLATPKNISNMLFNSQLLPHQNVAQYLVN